MTAATLLDVQMKQGAIVNGDGIVMDFGNAVAEHDAARSACALFDLSRRSQLEMTGSDRAKFLNNFCTNDVKSLAPGSGCEAFVTNVKGRVVGHIFVFAGADSLWIETVAGAEESLVPHLERYIINEDVAIHDRTAERGQLFVSGPQASEWLKKLACISSELQPYQHQRGRFADIDLDIRRVDLTGSAGYLLSAAREKLALLWTRLVDAGIRPAGNTAFDVLRIEAGMPLYGIDITSDNLAQEVGRTSQAISFTKGCYLGQEPVARLDALGHVNRELRGLRLASGSAPEQGAAVSDAGGATLGAVTSSAQLSTNHEPVALAYVRTSHAAPGSAVFVEAGGQRIAATVFWP